MYWAERRGKAYRNGKRIFNNSQRIELIGCDSRFHSSKETQNFFTTHNIKLIRRYGSALKFCKLAEGEVDVYPRFTKTKEWDTAAAHLIANEAGCKIVDIGTGEELLYNKEKIENNFFIASRIDLNFLI
jgi:3'(2'), 5'-bisphosphate nucleotidase